MSRPWLQDLKLKQLHRLAMLVGSHCSGNKAVRIDGIQRAVESAAALARSSRPRDGDLRIVSIDMGIRNLAYCSIKTPFPPSASYGLDSVVLDAWQRVELEKGSALGKLTARSKASEIIDSRSKTTSIEVKESFEPEVYARYAYSFIKKIIDEHAPTHILIERQRFRSGGGAAVQEWSIRVGVFEAMLYATLRTFIEQDYCTCTVLPMFPAVVNRFWLNNASEETAGWTEKKTPSDHIKKHKIQMVAKLLSSGSVEEVSFSLTDTASKTKDDFLAKLNKEKRPKPGGIPKLDDLADCLLQGLAWISWQRNRLNIESLWEKEIKVK